MRRRPISLAVALVAALAGMAQVAHGDGWAGAGSVKAPGGPYLTDAQGRALELHGVNLVAKCGGGSVDMPESGTPCVGPAQGPRLAYVLSPDADDPGRRFTAADAETLVNLGFNTVRLGIIWEGLEPGPANARINDPHYCAAHKAGTSFPKLGRGTDPYNAATVRAYLAKTDRIVALMAHAGLRVIIDMHSDAYGSAFFNVEGTTPWNGEGAPLWATCTGGARFRPTAGWGAFYLLRPIQLAMHHFFANDVRADLQGQFARVWQAVARHFRANPDVLGYEIYNEPNDYLVKHLDAELQCDYGGPVNEPKSCAANHHRRAAPRSHRRHPGRRSYARRLLRAQRQHDFGAPETIGTQSRCASPAWPWPSTPTARSRRSWHWSEPSVPTPTPTSRAAPRGSSTSSVPTTTTQPAPGRSATPRPTTSRGPTGR